MAADPYLAVTLDVKRRIAQVARVLELPHPGPAAWGLWELLEDVWRRKEPSVTALLLAACFGPDQRWPGVLVEFGFLVVKGTAWELCAEEADRLLRTHRQRVAAGKARTASGKRSAGGRLQRSTSGSPANDQRPASEPPAAGLLLQPAASSQQPAPEEKTSSVAPASVLPGSGTYKAQEAPLQPLKLEAVSAKKPPRARSEALQYFDAFQGLRQKRLGLVLEADPPPAQVNAWFARAIGMAGLQRLQAAAYKFIAEPVDDYWTKRGCPFAGFMSDSVWRKYVPPEEKTG